MCACVTEVSLPVGSVVLSIDAELGWGFHDQDDPPEGRIHAARDGWQTLLDLLAEYDVPATWAVVGHLLLDECDGYHVDHPSLPGWFQRERESWRDRPDLRFGPALIEAVASAEQPHEIGCHTFSHVVFDDPGVTRDILAAELSAAVELGRERGFDFDSFVFPRNAVAHRDLLSEYDFVACRGDRRPRPTGVWRVISKLRDFTRPPGEWLSTPQVDEDGLVDVPPSLYLFGFEGLPRRIAETVWIDPVVWQARRGIDAAVAESGVCHLWLHPNNLTTARDRRRMETILAIISDRRARTDLCVETMRSVAQRVLDADTDTSTSTVDSQPKL